MNGNQTVYILRIRTDRMTAQELLFYLIRGFADKSLTNDTVITVEDKYGKVDFILDTYTDTISDELYLFTFKSED